MAVGGVGAVQLFEAPGGTRDGMHVRKEACVNLAKGNPRVSVSFIGFSGGSHE